MLLFLPFLIGNFYSTNALEASKTIGIMRKTGTINIANNIQQVEFSLIIKTGNLEDPVLTWLSECQNKLASVLEIPAIKNPDSILTFGALSASVSQATEQSIKLISNIHQYKQAGKPTPQLRQCAGTIEDNVRDIVFMYKETLSSSYESLNPLWTVSDVKPKSVGFTTITNFYANIRSAAYDMRDHLEKLLHMLEALTSGVLNPALLANIQEHSCVDISAFDNIILRGCKKIDIGIYCELSVQIFGGVTQYNRYSPISYQGVEVRVPPNAYVVKGTDNDDTGLLYCDGEFLSTINRCKFQHWEDVKYLFSKDAATILKNCNFTFKTPNLPMQLPDQSILIQDSSYDLTISNLDGINPVSLENLSPFIVSLNKNSRLNIDKDRVHIQYRGFLETAPTNLQVSIFNETFIAAMHLRALQQTLWELNWEQLLYFGLLLLQVVVAPVAIVTCAISIYTIFKSVKRRRRRKKDRQMSLKSLNTNYKENKRYNKKHAQMSKH